MRKGQIGATIFIPVVIAVILLGVVFTFITDQRSTTTVTDDQFTASNTSCVEITNACINSITRIENASGGGTILSASNYTLCIATGTTNEYDGILLSPTASLELNGKTVNATYEGESCEAIDGMTGTMIDYIPVLLAVVLIIGVAVYIK